MPIDPTIRARMLELAEEYHAQTTRLLSLTTHLAGAKLERDNHEVGLLALETRPDGLINGTNDMTRKTQREAVLAGSSQHQLLCKLVQDAELDLRAVQASLDCLRFESAILVAIAKLDATLHLARVDTIADCNLARMD